MEGSQRRALSQDDLDRAVRSVATHFGTDKVFIVGSQALLVAESDVPLELRYSKEFDMYPPTETASGTEPSEEINALFGEGSMFHQTFGFFIDGVDETTARLPPDWMARAVTRQVRTRDGNVVTAIAPAPAEVVAAKLVRGDQKDLEFAARCFAFGLADAAAVADALTATLEGEELQGGLRRLRQAAG